MSHFKQPSGAALSSSGALLVDDYPCGCIERAAKRPFGAALSSSDALLVDDYPYGRSSTSVAPYGRPP